MCIITPSFHNKLLLKVVISTYKHPPGSYGAVSHKCGVTDCSGHRSIWTINDNPAIF